MDTERGVEASVALRPLTDGDHFLVRRWLREPEIFHWWGSVSAAEAEVNLALAGASTLCRMVCRDGVAIGYAHAGDAALWHSRLPAELPSGAWDMHVFIGDRAARGSGAGPAAIRLLLAEVWTTTLALACSVLVPIDSEAAVRVYEKAGFRWRGIVRDGTGRSLWLLVHEREGRLQAVPRHP